MPNNDYVKREDIFPAVTEIAKEIVFGNQDDDKVVDIINSIPAADVVPVVRCRDCKYKPIAPEGITAGFQVEFPDELDNPCPCNCGDGWYSEKPSDNFFCAYGAKMDTEQPKEENDGTCRTD